MILELIILIFVAGVSVFNVSHIRRQYRQNRVTAGWTFWLLYAVAFVMVFWTAITGAYILLLAWLIMLGVDSLQAYYYFEQDDE
ncbi:hypothetical protein M199_gp163 [Halogranum tailed virus 1]|uniref:Uncharacterized protein n=1 Tax=Halogranum tailed virus 1 TaxID=1273749 RepID=R4TMU0_9CAUD|nr:hypothetical protein M199_gp163 [Halogranum tailed virus 1]AGM11503.1 hypothetical protein HGTV1_206 [Halogranum tailed virus 1]